MRSFLVFMIDSLFKRLEYRFSDLASLLHYSSYAPRPSFYSVYRLRKLILTSASMLSRFLFALGLFCLSSESMLNNSLLSSVNFPPYKALHPSKDI